MLGRKGETQRRVSPEVPKELSCSLGAHTGWGRVAKRNSRNHRGNGDMIGGRDKVIRVRLPIRHVGTNVSPQKPLNSARIARASFSDIEILPELHFDGRRNRSLPATVILAWGDRQAG